jgi:predicted nucleic acid-binding protein
VILVDSGPLVAWVDAADPEHARCVEALKEVRDPMGTVWPAVAGALLALREVPRGQEAVLEILGRSAVRLVPIDKEDVPRMQELMARYQARRMDLAHAALVRVAERDGWTHVFTLDRPAFEAYRIGGSRKRFRIIPEAPPARRRRPSRRGRR